VMWHAGDHDSGDSSHGDRIVEEVCESLFEYGAPKLAELAQNWP
jgi:hypothetical protein